MTVLEINFNKQDFKKYLIDNEGWHKTHFQDKNKEKWAIFYVLIVLNVAIISNHAVAIGIIFFFNVVFILSIPFHYYQNYKTKKKFKNQWDKWILKNEQVAKNTLSFDNQKISFIQDGDEAIYHLNEVTYVFHGLDYVFVQSQKNNIQDSIIIPSHTMSLENFTLLSNILKLNTQSNFVSPT